MRSVLRHVTLSIGVVLIVTACSGDDGEPTTTAAESPQATATTSAPATTAASVVPGGGEEVDATTPSTQATPETTIEVVPAVPGYTIVQRLEVDEGVTAVILLDSYDSLTDIDLQNVVEDAVDRFSVYEAHVVDSQEAADLVLAEVEEPTTEGQALLAEHYLVRLEEGFRLVFQGRFASEGTVILGS